MITINGRFLTQETTGVQRFAREIVRAAVLSTGSRWIEKAELATPSGVSGKAAEFVQSIGLTARSVGRLRGHPWEQLELPVATRGRALVNLCNTAPVQKREQIVVLHDAAIASMPKNYSFWFRTWYRLMIRYYGARAAKIATVSDFSAQEIARYFNISRDLISVIPESGEHILRANVDEAILQRLGLDADRYFLAVSSMAPNKNFRMVVDAVSRMPPVPFRFVVVGGRNATVFKDNFDLPTGVVEAGYVSDSELRALYEHAACFIYPSLYEGFGLPPLEAMTCGCPVVVSNVASLPEVCGKAAAYFDPRDPADVASSLSRVLGSRTYRSELREAGLARSRLWTWRDAASRLEEIIDGLDRE